MRIAVLHSSQGVKDDYLDKEKRFLESFVDSNVEIHVRKTKRGPDSVETRRDVYLAAPELVKGVIKAEEEGFDAAVIACFLGPGLDIARNLVSMPVTSSGLASVLLANAIGGRFSIISITEEEVEPIREMIAREGFTSKLASIRAIDVGVLGFVENEQKALTSLVDEAQKAINQDGAEVILLGCGFLSFLANDVQSKVGVPVVSPYGAAMKLVKTLVELNLSPHRNIQLSSQHLT